MIQQPTAIEVRNLNVVFGDLDGFRAVDNLSFEIGKGGTLALVGASGSGKSVTSLAIMGLLPKNAQVSGQIRLPGKYDNLLQFSEREWTRIRGKEIAMVFQEPMSALNPIKTCGRQLMECILAHRKMPVSGAKKIALSWLEKVRLPDPARMFLRYPHQLSGGQKQRVVIAMAMCNHPRLLIADEPTTALDVTVQKEIITLMRQLQEEYGTAMLFITHDLSLAKMLTGDFLVMDKGRIADKSDLFTFERSPFQQALPEKEILIRVSDLDVHYPEKTNWLGKTTQYFPAVQKVSFDIKKGETLGLVGESGCGKSTLSKTLLGLQQATHGNIFFKDQDITRLKPAGWKRLRKDIQIIFQDPYASLNPRIKIGEAIAEPIVIHGLAGKKGVRARVEELLEQVGLSVSSYNKYPHEFSGGQRQRICIARALAVQPELVICDESVSALDIKIQAQILALLRELQRQFGLTYLFITHDLKVVRHVSNRVMVMRQGKIVEEGPTEQVMLHPRAAYTRQLLAAALP